MEAKPIGQVRIKAEGENVSVTVVDPVSGWEIPVPATDVVVEMDGVGFPQAVVTLLVKDMDILVDQKLVHLIAED